jgi:hypothetical protein
MFALSTQHFGTNSYEIVYISGSDKMTTNNDCTMMYNQAVDQRLLQTTT